MVGVLVWVVGPVVGEVFASSGLCITGEGLWVCCWWGEAICLCVYVCVSLGCFAICVVWWGRSELPSFSWSLGVWDMYECILLREFSL